MQTILEDVEKRSDAIVQDEVSTPTARDVLRREVERQPRSSPVSTELRIVPDSPFVEEHANASADHVETATAKLAIVPALEVLRLDEDQRRGVKDLPIHEAPELESKSSYYETETPSEEAAPLLSIVEDDANHKSAVEVDMDATSEQLDELMYEVADDSMTVVAASSLEIVQDPEPTLFHEGTLNVLDFQEVSEDEPGAVTFIELLAGYVETATFDTERQKRDVETALEYVLVLAADLRSSALEELSKVGQLEAHAELYDAVELLLGRMGQDTASECIVAFMNELLDDKYYFDPVHSALIQDLSHERKKSKADHLPYISLSLMDPARIILGKKAVSSSFGQPALMPV